MTSVSRISAHCADTKELVVRIWDLDTNQTVEERILQNGESTEVLMYDSRAVTSHEREKQ